MGKAMFYHLTQNPLEVTATNLLTRAYGQGLRVAVRARDAARLEWLDAALWLGHKASFLPHGLAGGPHDAAQPILLTTQTTSPNAARILPECGPDAAPVARACLWRAQLLVTCTGWR